MFFNIFYFYFIFLGRNARNADDCSTKSVTNEKSKWCFQKEVTGREFHMSLCWIIFNGFSMNLEKFEDAKGVLRSSKSKDRQYNRQKIGQNNKRWSTKETHPKSKDWAIRIRLKTMDEPMCSERVSNSCSTSDTRRVTLTLVVRHE